MEAEQKRQKAQSIVARLLANVSDIRYGEVSVALKIHAGRIKDITHTYTETMREYQQPETSGVRDGA